MKKTESQLLTEWFESQKHFKTWAELAKYLGIDHRTMSHYHMGRKLAVNPDHRSLLYEVTKIPAFSKEKTDETRAPRPLKQLKHKQTNQAKPPPARGFKQDRLPDSVESSQNDAQVPAQDEMVKLLSQVMEKLQEDLAQRQGSRLVGAGFEPRSAVDHAQKVLSLLLSLDRELQFFRHASPVDRNVLRQTVRGQDVGYITSLLKAMYDEDKFQSWQLLASYQMISRPTSGRREDER